MLQEKMIEKREECLNVNRMVCWEWTLEDQSGAKRTKKLDSGEDCKREIESSVFLFSFVVGPVEILFLVGGASRWLVPAAVATVFGGRGSGQLWK